MAVDSRSLRKGDVNGAHIVLRELRCAGGLGISQILPASHI